MMNYLLSNAYSGISPMYNMMSVAPRIGHDEFIPSHLPSGFVFLGFGLIMLVAFVFVVLMVVSIWKIFKKAHQSGWAGIIPIYNHLVMLRIIKKPEWWVLFLFVPVANIILGLSIVYHLAKAFGKGIGFTLGMIFLPFIFYPILAFGKAHYTAPHESTNLF